MHVRRAAARVVVVEQRHDHGRSVAPQSSRRLQCGGFDAGEHAGCDAGGVFIAQQALVARVAFAHQVHLRVVPGLGDAAKVAEVFHLHAAALFMAAAVKAAEHLGGHPEHDFLVTQAVQVLTQRQPVAREGGAQVGAHGGLCQVQPQLGRAGEVGFDAARQVFELVAHQLWKLDAQRGALGQGANGLDVLRLRRAHFAALKKAKGHADDVGVLGREQPRLGVDKVVPPAQCAPRHLFAQQL